MASFNVGKYSEFKRTVVTSLFGGFPLLQRISKPGFLFIFSVLFILIGLVLDDAMATLTLPLDRQTDNW